MPAKTFQRSTPTSRLLPQTTGWSSCAKPSGAAYSGRADEWDPGTVAWPVPILCCRCRLLPRLVVGNAACNAHRATTNWAQDSERLATQPAESAPHPHAFMLLVVRWLASLSVSDDRPLPTQGTPPRQLLQANPSYPGTVLSSVAGHEIKRIMAGVKACHWVLLPGLVR